MIGISMMPRERARRLSLFGAAFFFVLLIFVPVIGPEANGARRWIEFGVGQVQPSEFLKPFFVVAMAWLLSLQESDKSLPVFTISAVLTGGIAFLLMKQPDFGSTIIFCAVWLAMLALAGVNMRILIGLARRRRWSASSSLISSTTSRPRASTNSCSAPATISRPTMRCAR